MMVLHRALRAVAVICAFSLLSASCQSSLPEQNLEQNKQYNGYVAVERLARYLTSNEREQKLVTNLLSNMEEVFHIDPHVLFQNSSYLTVVCYNDMSNEHIKFYFTEQEPKIVNDFLQFNGYLSYSYSKYSKYPGVTLFKSWYEEPSRYNDWSSGIGFNEFWFKTINLNDSKQFDWYQPQP